MRDKIQVYKIHPDAILPLQHGAEEAGYDICTIEDFIIHPGESLTIGTGLVVCPPEGYHTEILLRSSLAYKHNIMLRNSVGLIDRSYCGPEDELRLMLYRLPVLTSGPISHGCQAYHKASDYHPLGFRKGDRLAQLVFRKTHVLEVIELDKAPKTYNRGGLGSTGV
jgi:dUTP pyrophosphatase